MNFDTVTKEQLAVAHDELAEVHERLAKTSILDVIHEEHASLAETLRQEAQIWRDMRDDIFDSKMGRKTVAAAS